ncbi:hypothetical protein RGU70_12245 [Herbaspirillum sp. RTI4]|uniref:hypothetical protein n=1 Tax=Herbaspirillum sp. RTI4 TaxID=3048640 RepID=UPI002AB5C530|nr:hypothetical protein [Herbaspirillum sp. RTI4]MDY7579094.1 hypothetical protein [Herbaspirillum sp. RTI4]MEA9981327.1 hypothetical protein [Herbaspirillum sp. RTI4]
MKTILKKIFGAGVEKKTPVPTASDYLIGVAQSCEIAAVLDAGHYSAILIQLDVPSTEFKQHLVDHDALTVFVKIIEQRINDKDFEDPMPNRQNLGLKSPSPTLDEVKRIVVAGDQKIICNWSK